jgi:hypothetical protein
LAQFELDIALRLCEGLLIEETLFEGLNIYYHSMERKQAEAKEKQQFKKRQDI